MRCIQHLLEDFADAVRREEITEEEAAYLLHGLADAIGPMTVIVSSDTDQQRIRAKFWQCIEDAVEKQKHAYAKRYEHRLDALLLRLASVLRDQEKVPPVEELAAMLQSNHEDASTVRRRFLYWCEDIYNAVQFFQERQHRIPTLKEITKITSADINEQDVRAILSIVAAAKAVVKEDVYKTLQPLFYVLETTSKQSQ
jgi:hypothetical protein